MQPCFFEKFCGLFSNIYIKKKEYAASNKNKLGNINTFDKISKKLLTAYDNHHDATCL